MISYAKLKLMGPLLRHSGSRDAYVLRGVGQRYGPVYRLLNDTAGERDPAA